MGRRRAAKHHGATLLRLRAALAGALVLGVGSSVTLAAWTDSDQATGSFGASVFATESTAAKPYVASGPWAANDTAPGASLLFQATAMSPGTVFYAPFAIRTTEKSVEGTVALGIPAVTSSGTGIADLGAALRYRVVRSASCDAAAFGGTPAFVVGSDGGKPLTQGQAAGVVNPLAAATANQPGLPTQFCFEVSLPAGASTALQGQTATVTWPFTATSTA
ncbi:SipW-dependent-type signal peptide-containing protein [Arthrobacter sp. 31Y]|uniref:SipW-dependent-type signal peptide-containing protein n=1 Tax=Arthrobacter sp. 31Y TaxID=1115632 RepID=UPI0009DF809C|nr:SipW-dependent-type signal peptide-containing protein [Arthrobacter sp. 31Y]